MKKSLFILPLLTCCISCSTVKLVPEGQYRLDRNTIEVSDSKDFPEKEVTAYLKQQPNGKVLGLNLLLNIYNWSDGSGKGLNGLWEKLGEAPVVFNPTLVDISRSNISRRLQYLGYYDSRVSSAVRYQRRLASVKYNITLGERYLIDDVSYELPENESFRRNFYADTLESVVKRGGVLSESLLDEEKNRSMSKLRDFGYFSLQKDNYTFVADTLGKGHRASLKYIISEDEGAPMTQCRIGSVSISYPDDLKIDEKLLNDMNLVVPGALYKESTVNNTYTRFSSLKVFNTVGIEMSRNSDREVDCNISLSQAPLQGIKFNLEASTNSSGLMGISPQLNYYHKNIFHGGEWLNIGVVGNHQFRFTDDTRSNEFGLNANLSLPKFLGLGYSRFKGPNIPRTEFGISLNYQNRPEYTRNITSFTFGYSGVYKSSIFYQIYPLQLSYVRLYDMQDAFASMLSRYPYMKYSYQDHFDAGVGGNIYHTTDTDIVPKSSYRYSRLIFDLSGNILSGLGAERMFGVPLSQYARAELQLGKTVRFGKKERSAVATRVLAGAGYAYGNSSSLPYEKQLFCGGSTSMRGWQTHALGPGFSAMDPSFSIPSQSGDLKFEADAEYRFSMTDVLEWALFAEVGNIWSIKDRYTFNDMVESLAMDWGLGFRVNLNVILLRIDMGLQLFDPAAEDRGQWYTPVEALKGHGYAIHFGVGYPF